MSTSSAVRRNGDDPPFRYETTVTAATFAHRLRSATRVVILTHTRPDGDAVGSAIALARVVVRLGGHASIVLSGDIPAPIERIAAGYGYTRSLSGAFEPEPDLIVIVDTGSWGQLDDAADWLRARRSSIVVCDHHLRGDDVADDLLVDPSCASTTQLLLRLFVDEMEMDLTSDLAEPLFVGLATDTGWFRHANADAGVFADAARLLAVGVDKVRLYREIEESHPVARLRLEALALRSMEFCAGDRAVVMSLSAGDMRDAGGDPSMLSGLVNMPLVVESIDAVALLVESGERRVKVSFRSKMGAGGEPTLDVNLLAGEIGGGGHAQAAGARLHASLAESRSTIRSLFESAL